VPSKAYQIIQTPTHTPKHKKPHRYKNLRKNIYTTSNVKDGESEGLRHFKVK
jgi:hypothetical protein